MFFRVLNYCLLFSFYFSIILFAVPLFLSIFIQTILPYSTSFIFSSRLSLHVLSNSCDKTVAHLNSNLVHVSFQERKNLVIATNPSFATCQLIPIFLRTILSSLTVLQLVHSSNYNILDATFSLNFLGKENRYRTIAENTARLSGGQLSTAIFNRANSRAFHIMNSLSPTDILRTLFSCRNVASFCLFYHYYTRNFYFHLSQYIPLFFKKISSIRQTNHSCPLSAQFLNGKVGRYSHCTHTTCNIFFFL